MKIFISHQKADSELAHGIAKRLDAIHDIASYLDVIDPIASQTGDALGEYLRAQMGQCTQLIVVVSDSTKGSWWVPWEIGIATEKDYPIATYAEDKTPLPEYLKKWPYLTGIPDLDTYARVSKTAATTYRVRKGVLNESESEARRTSTREFYRNVRAALGQ